MKKIKHKKNLRGREAVWNDDALRVAETNAVLVEPIEATGWFKVSPYGEFPGRQAGRLQYFGQKQAETMAAEFNSVLGKMGRMFRGLPVYIGHPDVDPVIYSDHRRLGKIKNLEARADGLYAEPEWNSLGRENVTEGFWVYPSPYWDAPAGRSRFEPDHLISIGLTNVPRILPDAGNEPVANAGGTAAPVADSQRLRASATESDEKDNNQPTNKNDMDRTALTKKLGLDPEATDEEINARIDKIMVEKAEKEGEAAKKAAETESKEAEAAKKKEDTANALISAEKKATELEGEIKKIREGQGDSAFFNDALDVSHPPFAFNSGMGWREISAAEWVRLGGGIGRDAQATGDSGRDVPTGHTIRATLPRNVATVKNADGGGGGLWDFSRHGINLAGLLFGGLPF